MSLEKEIVRKRKEQIWEKIGVNEAQQLPQTSYNLHHTHLNEVFSDFGAVEHGVEGGHLVHSHGGHVQHLGDLVHRSEGKPATGLSLSQVQHGNNAGLLVVLGVSVHNKLGLVQKVIEGEKSNYLGNSLSKRGDRNVLWRGSPR